MNRARRARIVATLGPASRAPGTVKALAQAGVDVFRLNFSHGSHEDHAAALVPAMHAVDAATGIRFETLCAVPPFQAALDDPAVRLAQQLAGTDRTTLVGFGTEAGLFVAMAGIPTVVVGPGSIGEAHTPNEFIEKVELEKCGVFVDRLIDHCRG